MAFAEIELEDEAQHLALPSWVGREVTGDPRFRKRALVGACEPTSEPCGQPAS